MRGGWAVLINGILERRAKRKEVALRLKLQNVCPHARVEIDDKEKLPTAVQLLLISPPGQIHWHCSQCGFMTHDPAYWRDRYSEIGFEECMDIVKRNTELAKIAKRQGWL